MKYLISKFVKTSFNDTMTKVGNELKKEGFIVLTEIDITETIKKKLDVDFGNYKIIGACHPLITYRALLVDKDIGVMFPCNFVIRELINGQIRVSAINPITAMRAARNYKLSVIASEISHKLNKVLDNL